MSWHCSRALVEAFSEATSSDGALSAPLNGSSTLLLFCAPDRMTAFSRLSRFGTTFKPLTDDRGLALLTWYRAGFRAKTSALPARAPASTESDPACGRTWHGSLAKFDRDTSSWKTVQRSLLGDSDECLVTWPRSGMTADGLCWELPMSGRRIKEIGSGLWPTPTVCGNYNKAGRSAKSGDGLATAVKMWATPVRRDYRHPGRSRLERTGGTQGECLPQQVGGALNPTWVEWLMGWPLGWTDLSASGTDKFRQWQQQHGDCSVSREARASRDAETAA